MILKKPGAAARPHPGILHIPGMPEKEDLRLPEEVVLLSGDASSFARDKERQIHSSQKLFGQRMRSGVDKRVAFQKGGFGGCSPGTKTGTRAHVDVPPERKTGREGTFACSPGTKRGEKRNEGTFAKTTLLRNRPLVSQ